MRERTETNCIVASIAFVLCAILAVLTFAGLSPDARAESAESKYSGYDSKTHFVIASQEDFEEFIGLFEENGDLAGKNFSGKNIILYCDADLRGKEFTFPDFFGTFEGNGHSVRGLSTELFATVDSGAAVRNLNLFVEKGEAAVGANKGTLDNVNVFGKIRSAASESSPFASFVGENSGMIMNCGNFAEITGKADNSGSTVSLAGIAKENVGSIKCSVFAGDFNLLPSATGTVTYDVGGIALRNKGSVEKCAVAANVVSVPEARYTLNFFAAGNIIKKDNEGYGSIKNTAAFCGFKNRTDCDGAKLFGCEDLESAPVTHVYGVVKFPPSGEKIFLNNELSPECGDLTETKLGTEFTFSDGAYPYPTWLYEKDSEDKYLIKDIADLRKLRLFCNGDAFRAKVVSDLRVTDLPSASAVEGFSYNNDNDLDFDGRAAVGVGSSEPYFPPDMNITCRGVFYFDSDNKIFGEDEESSFAFEPSGDGEITGETPPGRGTEKDPYSISSAENLKWFLEHGVDKEVGVLKEDVIVNSPSGAGSRRLNNSTAEMQGVLYGNGHGIIGLNREKLAETIAANGKISGVTARGVGCGLAGVNNGTLEYCLLGGYGDDQSHKNALTESNSGKIENCIAYGNNFFAGFAETNRGRGEIISCVNKAGGGYAFAETNEGTVNKCSNRGEAETFVNSTSGGSMKNCIDYRFSPTESPAEYTGLESSLKISSDGKSYAIYNEVTGVPKENLSYYNLKKYDKFDFNEVFGYPKGADGETPELRVKGREYKTEAASPFGVLEDKEYSPDRRYLVKELENRIETPETCASVVFEWSCGDDTEIRDAGTYSYTAVFKGDKNLLSAETVGTFTIKKALRTAITPPYFSDGPQYVYTGEPIVLTEKEMPAESLVASLADEKFELEDSYATPEGDENRCLSKNVGKYVWYFKYVSPNYTEPWLAHRKFDIVPKILTLSWPSNVTAEYGAEFSPRSIDLKLKDGENDAAAEVAEVLGEDYLNNIKTNYKKGDPAGKYDLRYEGSLSNGNYALAPDSLTAPDALSVTQADPVVVTSPAAVPDLVYDGTEKALITAGEAEGGEIRYSLDNAPYSTDIPKACAAGTYEVRFEVIGDVNHKDITPTTIRVTIEKAVLTITFPKVRKNFGTSPVKLADYPPNISGPGYKEENYSAVFGGNGLVFLIDGGEPVEEFEADPKKKYEYTCDKPTLDNYEAKITRGYILNVELLPLTAFPGSPVFSDADKVYDGENHKNELETGFVAAAFPEDFVAEYVDIKYEHKSDGNPVEEVKNVGIYEFSAVVTPREDRPYYDEYLPTTYRRKVSISKKDPRLKFNPPPSAEYDGEEFGNGEEFGEKRFDIENPYNLECIFKIYEVLQSGPAVVGKSSCKNAGKYEARLYCTNPNYTHNADDPITQAFEILPKPLALPVSVVLVGEDGSEKNADLAFAETVLASAETVYDGVGYNVKPSAAEGAIASDEAVLKYSCYTFADGVRGEPTDRIKNAGEYFIEAEVNAVGGAGNYKLEPSGFKFVVNPEEVEVEFGSISYLYGYTGSYGSEYCIGPYSIKKLIERNEGEPGPKDFTVRLNDNGVGIYNLEDDNLQPGGNYRYTFKKNAVNVVKIIKRSIKAEWYWKGVPVADTETAEIPSSKIVYEGRDLTDDWTGSARGIGGTSLPLSKKATSPTGEGSDIKIYDVGEYTVRFEFSKPDDERNYSLENVERNIIVEKAKIDLKTGDAQVRQREAFVPTVFVSPDGSGPKGADVGKEPLELDGARIVFSCGYVPGTSQVGDTFPIGISSAEFKNYESGTFTPGTLTVIKNDFPEYGFPKSEVTVPYNGEYQSCVIPNVDKKVTVIYSENSFREAGRHIVRAVVKYPSGREENVSCVFVIAYAYPRVSVNPIYLPYKKGVTLSDDLIKGSAYLGASNEERLVSGKFHFRSENSLEEGEKEYECIFYPDDRNVLSVPASVTVISAEINLTFLNIEGEYSVADGTFEFENPVTVTLRPNLPLPGLALAAGKKISDKIILSGGESFDINILYEGSPAFTYPVKTRLLTEESPPRPPVKVDAGSLALTGMELSGGNVLKVSENGGRITLAENMENGYTLYINGREVAGDFILNGDEGEITLYVFRENPRRIVYSETFVVEKVSPEREAAKKRLKLSLIISGSVIAGAAAVLAVTLVVWKRKH